MGGLKMKNRMLLCIIVLLALATTATAQKMTVKDSDGNVLMEVNDEGTVGSIKLSSGGSAPATTTDKLYNVDGVMFWDGTDLTAGGSSLWSVAGSDIYYNGGNVGIGTTSPAAKLHAFIPSGSGSIRLEHAVAGFVSYDLKNNNTDYSLGLTGANFEIREAGVPKMIVSGGTGNVGIGTTGPAVALHLSSSSSSFGMLRVENSNTGDNEATIGFKEGSDAAGSELWLTGVAPYGLTNDFVIGRDGAKFLIKPNGRVGIGTTDPFADLHVAGEILALEQAGVGLSLRSSASGGSPGLYHWVDNTPGFTQVLKIGLDADKVVFFAGNVGIKATSPQASLHIKQRNNSSTGGIRLEFNSDTDYWETYIDGADDYNFAYIWCAKKLHPGHRREPGGDLGPTPEKEHRGVGSGGDVGEVRAARAGALPLQECRRQGAADGGVDRAGRGKGIPGVGGGGGRIQGGGLLAVRATLDRGDSGIEPEAGGEGGTHRDPGD